MSFTKDYSPFADQSQRVWRAVDTVCEVLESLLLNTRQFGPTKTRRRRPMLCTAVRVLFPPRTACHKLAAVALEIKAEAELFIITVVSDAAVRERVLKLISRLYAAMAHAGLEPSPLPSLRLVTDALAPACVDQHRQRNARGVQSPAGLFGHGG